MNRASILVAALLSAIFAATPGHAQSGKAGASQQRAQELTAKLDRVAEQLWNPELQADEDSLVYTPKLDFQFAALAGVLATADARPTAASRRYDVPPWFTKGDHGGLGGSRAWLGGARHGVGLSARTIRSTRERVVVRSRGCR